MIELQFSAVEFERIVENLRKAGVDCGIEIKHLVWEEVANACNNLVKHSPPVVDGGGAYGAQKRIGQQAIEAEIDRQFAITDGPDTATWTTKDGRRWVRRERLAFDATDRILDSGGQVETHHKYFRRFGSAARRARAEKSAWTTKKVLKKYLGAEKKEVGQLKAGWLPALLAYAAKTNKPVKVPQWIARHAVPCIIQDTLTDQGNGAVRVENGCSYAEKRLPRSLAMWVVRQAEEDAKKWIELRAAKIAKRIEGGAA